VTGGTGINAASDDRRPRTLAEDFMTFIWAIIVGLVVGLIARAILPGRQNIPLWLTALLGIVESRAAHGGRRLDPLDPHSRSRGDSGGDRLADVRPLARQDAALM